MTNLDIINDEIETLERKEITYEIARKLACLYCVRDHMATGEVREVVSVAEEDETLPQETGSEFLQAVAGKKASDIMPIMDELMNSINVLQPRIYDSIMRKIANV